MAKERMKNRMSHIKNEIKKKRKIQEFRWAAVDGNGDDDGRHLKKMSFTVPFIAQSEKKTRC